MTDAELAEVGMTAHENYLRDNQTMGDRGMCAMTAAAAAIRERVEAEQLTALADIRVALGCGEDIAGAVRGLVALKPLWEAQNAANAEDNERLRAANDQLLRSNFATQRDADTLLEKLHTVERENVRLREALERIIAEECKTEEFCCCQDDAKIARGALAPPCTACPDHATGCGHTQEDLSDCADALQEAGSE